MSPEHHQYGLVYIGTVGTGRNKRTGVIKESLGLHRDLSSAAHDAEKLLREKDGQFKILVHPYHEIHALASQLAAIRGLPLL
jgi:hypothetical protein